MIEKTTIWALNHKKLLATLLIIGAFLVSIVTFFSNNALVYIEVDTSINKDIAVYTSSDAETKKVSDNAGLLLVSRDSKSLIVSAGDYSKTQTKLQIPWYGFVTKNVVLKRDKDAQKIAYRSTLATTCSTYHPKSDQLAYYDCTNPIALMKYTAPRDKPWMVKKIASIYYSNKQAVPYRGGVIGISHTKNTDGPKLADITYVTKDGENIAFNAPTGTNRENILHAKLFTDTSDSDNNRFIFADYSGFVYLGIPSSDNTVKYTKVSPPLNYNPIFNQTVCAINGEVSHCYYGKSITGDYHPEESNKTIELAQTSISTLSFSDGVKETRTVNELPVVDSLYTTDDGKLYAKNYKQLLYLDVSGNTFVPVEISQNVDSVGSNDNLYFVQDGGVFELDKSTLDSYQVFYSPNIAIKKVYATTDHVFAIGTAGDNSSITYAYAIDKDSENTNPGKRLIDNFPSQSTIPAILSNDVVGDNLYVQLSISYDKSSPNPVSPGEIAIRKEEVLYYLKSKNIEIDQKDIIFTY